MSVETDTIRHLDREQRDLDYADALQDFWTAEKLDEHFAEIIGATGLTATEFAVFSIAANCGFDTSAALDDSLRGRRLARAMAVAGLRMQTIYDQHIDEGRTEFRLSQRGDA